MTEFGDSGGRAPRPVDSSCGESRPSVPVDITPEQRAMFTLIGTLERLLGAIDNITITPERVFGLAALSDEAKIARDVLHDFPDELLDG